MREGGREGGRGEKKRKKSIIIFVMLHAMTSGGSRNFERGVQQVRWHMHSAPLKAVCRAAKW